MSTYYVNSAVGADANLGTAPGAGNAWATLVKAAATVAAGDTVYIEAIANNSASYPTTSLDYVLSDYINPASGTTSAGFVRWLGRNGIPTIGCTGMAFYGCSNQRFEGLYLVATSATYATYGIFYASATGSTFTISGCIINMGNQPGVIGVNTASGGLILDSEIYGGTTTPTASAGSEGVRGGDYNTHILGCRIHHCRDVGVNDNGHSGTRVESCRIYGCAGNGVTFSAVNLSLVQSVSGSTIDGNGGHGIAVTGTGGIACVAIYNNIISNHVGSGKYGIEVSDGTTTLNDSRKKTLDYNNIYNNTSNYHNISAGLHDLAVNPTYANASAGDFTPGNAALQAGFP